MLTSLYALFYLAGMITSIYKGELSLSNPIDVYFLVLSIVFMVGFVLSWTNVKIADIWIFAGIAVLLQGVIYIKHHYQYPSQ